MVKIPGIVKISAELITDTFSRLIYPCQPRFILKQWYTPFFGHFKCFFQFFFHCHASPSAQTNAEVNFTIVGPIFWSTFTLKTPKNLIPNHFYCCKFFFRLPDMVGGIPGFPAFWKSESLGTVWPFREWNHLAHCSVPMWPHCHFSPPPPPPHLPRLPPPILLMSF